MHRASCAILNIPLYFGVGRSQMHNVLRSKALRSAMIIGLLVVIIVINLTSLVLIQYEQAGWDGTAWQASA
ncbi:MAG: hypothetical protein OHK0023_17850 [Anaerolineae bacterium]